MAKLILVCGPTGVGKTTYSVSLSKEIGAIRFSIDPWMQTLFSKDMTTLDYSWMMERVSRCYEQIWQVSEQILAISGSVILELGFTTKAQRDIFSNRARELDINPEIHYLDAPKDTPQSKKLYGKLERKFLQLCEEERKLPADMDLKIWKCYACSSIL